MSNSCDYPLHQQRTLFVCRSMDYDTRDICVLRLDHSLYVRLSVRTVSVRALSVRMADLRTVRARQVRICETRVRTVRKMILTGCATQSDRCATRACVRTSVRRTWTTERMGIRVRRPLSSLWLSKADKHIIERQAKSQQIAEQSLLSCLQCLLPTKSSA